MHIIEVKDKTGRMIHLTHEHWKHIATEHPETNQFFHEIEETLKNPTKITDYIYDKNIKYYYKYIKQEKNKYLLIIVKYLNGDGFIITAYFTRNIK